jgi:NDP-sugar pyrophosphorylase family protein
MHAHTRTVPKAMISVAGRPFADRQLTLLAKQGFTDVVYSIGYRGDMIQDFVGTGERWGVRVTWVDEGDDLRGTAGALRLAFEAGLLSDEFAVVYGDSFLPIDIHPIKRSFDRGHQPALMTVYRNDGRLDASNVVYVDGTVIRYQKGVADPSMQYIDYGLTWLRRSVVEERVPTRVVVDLAEVYTALSAAGLLAGYEVLERFYEVGSPAGLVALERFLAPDPGGPPR